MHVPSSIADGGAHPDLYSVLQLRRHPSSSATTSQAGSLWATNALSTVALPPAWPHMNNNTSWRPPHHWSMQSWAGVHPGTGGLPAVAGAVLESIGRNYRSRSNENVRPRPGQMGSGVLQNSLGAWRAAGIAVSENVAGRVDESANVGAQANPTGVYPVLPIHPLPQQHGTFSLLPPAPAAFNPSAFDKSPISNVFQGDNSRYIPPEQPQTGGTHQISPRLVNPGQPGPSTTFHPAHSRSRSATAGLPHRAASVYNDELNLRQMNSMGTKVDGVGRTSNECSGSETIEEGPANCRAGGSRMVGSTVAPVTARETEPPVSHNPEGAPAVAFVSSSRTAGEEDGGGGGGLAAADNDCAKWHHAHPHLPINHLSSSSSPKKCSLLVDTPTDFSKHQPGLDSSSKTCWSSTSPDAWSTTVDRAPVAEIGHQSSLYCKGSQPHHHVTPDNTSQLQPTHCDPTRGISGSAEMTGLRVATREVSEDGGSRSPGGGAGRGVGVGVSEVVAEGEDPDSWFAGVQAWTGGKVENRAGVPLSPVWHALRNDIDAAQEAPGLFMTESEDSLYLNVGPALEPAQVSGTGRFV